MKTFWQRLWWAVVGYRTEPWPVLPPPPQVLTQEELESVFGQNQAPGGVLSPYQHEHLRGSIKLAADLLAPHFQSAISASSLGAMHGAGRYDYKDSWGNRSKDAWIGYSEYLPAETSKEEIDLLLSGAAWLAKHSELAEREFSRLSLIAQNDIYHP